MTMVSNRLSYVFDFRGPEHVARHGLLVVAGRGAPGVPEPPNGECAMALAGGVNVMVTPEYTIAESKGGMLAPDGRSKPSAHRRTATGAPKARASWC